MLETIRLILRDVICILVFGLGVYAAVFGIYQLAMVCFLFLIWAEIVEVKEENLKDENGSKIS